MAAELGSLALLAHCPWLLVVRRDGGRAAGNQLVPVGVSRVAAGPVTVGWGPPRSVPLSPPQARTVAPGGRPQFPVLSLQPVPASSPGYWLLCSWRPAWTPQEGPTSRAWSLGRPRGRPGHPPKRRRSGQGQATGRTGGCGGLSEGSLERPIRWPRPPQAPGDTPGPGTRSRPLFDIWETQQKHKRKTPPNPPRRPGLPGAELRRPRRCGARHGSQTPRFSRRSLRHWMRDGSVTFRTFRSLPHGAKCRVFPSLSTKHHQLPPGIRITQNTSMRPGREASGTSPEVKNLIPRALELDR